MHMNRKRMTGSFAAASAAAVGAICLSAGGAIAAPADANGRAVTQGAHSTADLGSASVSGSSYHGCPAGAVCIYPGSGWNNDKPSNVYWSYGVHKLYNQYGTHMVDNHQYGGATVSFCKGSNGTNCGSTMRGWTHGKRYLTPINSIKLSP